MGTFKLIAIILGVLASIYTITGAILLIPGTRNGLIKALTYIRFGKFLDNRYQEKYFTYRKITTNLNYLLSLKNLNFKIFRKKYELSKKITNTEIIEGLKKCFNFYSTVSIWKRIINFNGSVARLNDVKNIDVNEIDIELQDLEYFDYIKTHLCVDAKIMSKIKENRFSNSLRDYILNENKDFYKELARPLGINILLKTDDDFIILQKRSKVVNIYQNLLYPTASGSLKFADAILLEQMSKNEDMKKFVLSSEVYEETGIFPDRILSLKFLGIFEDEYRLFVPDAFFVGTTNLSYGNGEIEKKYKEFKDKIKDEVVEIKFLYIDDFWALKGSKEWKNYIISQNLKVYLEEQNIVIDSKFWVKKEKS